MLEFIRRSGVNSDGVAAVEFALVLPILVAVMFFSIEVSIHIWTRNKVQNFTLQIADIISRENDGELTVSEIDSLFENLDKVTDDRMKKFAQQKAIVMYDFSVDTDCVNPFDVDEACIPIPTPIWFYNDGFIGADLCDVKVVDNDVEIKLGDINEGYLSNAPVLAVFFNLEYEPVISSNFGRSSSISAYRILAVRNGSPIEASGAGFEKCS